eukprot:7450762-Lingulodinium_polyedra.AAC.2
MWVRQVLKERVAVKDGQGHWHCITVASKQRVAFAELYNEFEVRYLTVEMAVPQHPKGMKQLKVKLYKAAVPHDGAWLYMQLRELQEPCMHAYLNRDF